MEAETVEAPLESMIKIIFQGCKLINQIFLLSQVMFSMQQEIEPEQTCLHVHVIIFGFYGHFMRYQ